MTKLLNPIKEAIIVFIAAAVLSGCGKESTKKNFVARVNDTYLSKEELASLIDTAYAGKFYKNEVVRNWINKELLYQEAQKKGILKDEEFNRLLNYAKLELAAALLVKRQYEEEKVNYEPNDLEDFYNKNKNEFARFYDSYFIDLIEFKDEDRAVQFRTTVLESDWEKALNVFKGDSSISKVRTGQLLYDYEIHPVTLLRIVQDLNPGEISIIINNGPDQYLVVQLIQKYGKDSVPPFDVIKQQVEERFLAQRKEEFVRNYLKELYSNNDIEVRN